MDYFLSVASAKTGDSFVLNLVNHTGNIKIATSTECGVRYNSKFALNPQSGTAIIETGAGITVKLRCVNVSGSIDIVGNAGQGASASSPSYVQFTELSTKIIV